MKRIQTYIELFIIFLCSLTPLLWLSGGEIVLGHDSGMRLISTGYLRALWYSWNPASNFGVSVSVGKGFLVAQLPEVLFTKLTGSLTIGQTMSFIFWFFVIGISMYALMKRFFPEKQFGGVRLMAAIFYMYNFFLLQGWFIAERAKFSLFAALPLVFVISWDTLSGRYPVMKGSILFGLTLFALNGGGSPPMYGAILIALGILFAFFIISSVWQKSWKGIMRILMIGICFAVVTACLNAYWFIPQLTNALGKYQSQLTNLGGVSGILSWEATISKHVNPLNLFRFQGMPDWYDNPSHTYARQYLTNPLFIILSYIPILALVYALFRKELWLGLVRQRAFLAVIFLIYLIGIVFTAGSSPPFGLVYTTLLKTVPGFAIFRSVFYKFGPSVWFSAVILTSLALYLIMNKYVRNKSLAICLNILIIIGILGYHYPYFTGRFFRWNEPFSTKVTLPAYASDMFSYINGRYGNEETQILLLPPLDTRFFADSYTWGFWSLDLLPRLGLQSTIVANDGNVPLINAVYSAVFDNNPALFYSLIHQIGVQKILWRDDILYSDLTTKSDRYAYIRDDFLQPPYVRKEKEFGAWTLYSVEGQAKKLLVSAESVFNRGSVDNKALESLFGRLDQSELPIVQEDSLQNTYLADALSSMTGANVISATCMFCNPQELFQIENALAAPYVRFLPDSPFYSVVRWKEQRALASYKKGSPDRANAHLGFAAKRLIEISGIINRDIRDNTDSLAKQTMDRFQRHVEDTISETAQFSEIDRSIYRAKIISYLKFYTKYLAGLDEKNILPKAMITTVYENLQRKIAIISEDIWISDPLTNNKYYLTVPQSDHYQLLIVGSRGNPTSVVLDDKEISDFDSVFLSAGIHKLTLSFAAENSLSTSGFLNKNIDLEYGEFIRFPTSKINFTNLYMLKLDYQIKGGRSVYLSYFQDNDNVEGKTGNRKTFIEPLSDDGKWHTVRTIIPQNYSVKDSAVAFFTADTSDIKSQLGIAQMTLQNITPVSVFAVKRNAVTPKKAPDITYKQINPAVYLVSVTGADNPYILRFLQAFEPGWRIYAVPAGHGGTFTAREILSLLQKPLDSQGHFQLNGHVNAWYLDAAGTYDLILIYWPYVIFLFSVCLSVISLILSVIVYVTKFRK